MEGEIVSAATRWELEADSQLDYFDDILHDLVGHDRVSALKKEQMLEVIPLGRMRGRTFKNAFIILDEAQNTTVAKMRMAVTRIGKGSRMVVTGDPTNVELLGDEQSGLVDLLNMLEGTDLAKIHRFDGSAIIRDSVAIRLEELYAARQNRGQNIAPVDAFGRRSGPIQRSEVSATRIG
jgi:phosphate starvation-inducible PhoH-like protein